MKELTIREWEGLIEGNGRTWTPYGFIEGHLCRVGLVEVELDPMRLCGIAGHSAFAGHVVFFSGNAPESANYVALACSRHEGVPKASLRANKRMEKQTIPG